MVRWVEAAPRVRSGQVESMSMPEIVQTMQGLDDTNAENDFIHAM
jgi:hypothetical protein